MLEDALSNDKAYLVHIAKCGGTTIREQVFIRKLAIEYDKYSRDLLNIDPTGVDYWKNKISNERHKKWIDLGVIGCHQHTADISEDYRYIITVRNPIKRFVSAYYWKLEALETNAYGENCPEELAMLQAWGSANGLAEALYDDAGNLNDETDQFIQKRWTIYMNHIGMDINYYLGELLDNIGSSQVLGVIAAETLPQDLVRVLGGDPSKVGHKKKNDKYPREISEKAYNNLKSYLEDDYECLRKLDSWGHITDEQRPYLFDDAGVKIKG